MEHVLDAVGKLVHAFGISWWRSDPRDEGSEEQEVGAEREWQGDAREVGDGAGDESVVAEGGERQNESRGVRIRLLRGESESFQVVQPWETSDEILCRAFGQEDGRNLRLLYLGRVLGPTERPHGRASPGAAFHVIRSGRARPNAERSPPSGAQGRWIFVQDDSPPFDSKLLIFLVLSGVIVLYCRLLAEGNLRGGFNAIFVFLAVLIWFNLGRDVIQRYLFRRRRTQEERRDHED